MREREWRTAAVQPICTTEQYGCEKEGFRENTDKKCNGLPQSPF